MTVPNRKASKPLGTKRTPYLNMNHTTSTTEEGTIKEPEWSDRKQETQTTVSKAKSYTNGAGKEDKKQIHQRYTTKRPQRTTLNPNQLPHREISEAHPPTRRQS